MSVIAEAGTAPRATTRPERLRLRVVETLDEAGAVWRALEARGAGSAYQSRRFLQSWVAHVAPATGIAPRIGLVSDESDKAVALLPFGISRRGPLRAVVYLGGRDSNLNMPLVDPAATIAAGEARALLRRFGRAISPRPDLFILANQPRSWQGTKNPFVFANAAPSPSAAFGAHFGGDAEAFLAARESRDTRKKLRAKATRLASLGPVIFERVPRAQARDIADEFVAQKAARLAQRGIPGGFDSPHQRAFFENLAAPPENKFASEPALEFHVLRVGAVVAAIFGGLPQGRHWHGLINSYRDDPSIARCSPGDLLVRETLAELGRRGFQSFDLGIGEARYKNALCDETIDLFDTVFPLSVPGRIFAGVETLRIAAKRAIKQNPSMMKAVLDVRAALKRIAPPR